jgi:beta-propeller repeat-containing protein
VAVGYALEGEPRARGERYGFRVGTYDRDRPLVIDPLVLISGGFIGGDDDDEASGIALDSDGNAYIVGTTSSDPSTFPMTAGPDTTLNGGQDVFIAKVNAAGTALVYCGYIGGGDDDLGQGIAVDSAGNAYVTGSTSSTEEDFPVRQGPDLTFNGGLSDAFVAKVNADGTTLVYCGYIGGGGDDFGQGIAVDTLGHAYVTGSTSSTQATFPVADGPDLSFNGVSDAFVAKVNTLGTALVYGGYIGGPADDHGTGIAVDTAGNAYVTGFTKSDQIDFPVTVGPDLTSNGGIDAFVAKVDAAGTALVYCGYIGGSGTDEGTAIAVDSAGNAYVTGFTASTQATFPVVRGPDLTVNGGKEDAFVAKVNAAGTALVYCGYIGGAAGDEGAGIAVDSLGNASVTGFTNSTEATFPVLLGPDLTFGGKVDAFLARVNNAGTGLFNCSYIGGIGEDAGTGVAVDSAGNAYVTGRTASTQATFPVQQGPDLTSNGDFDAFVAKIGLLAVERLTVSPSTVPGCRNATGTVVLNAPSPTDTLISLRRNSILVSVPASLVIPAGTISQDFPITTGPVSSSVNVTITAFLGPLRRGARPSQTATLVLRPIGVQAVTLSPNPAVGGSVVNGQVSLECPAGPSPITVSLSTSNASAATVSPTDLVIPSGASVGSFQVSTTQVQLETHAEIHASANGLGAGAILTLIPPSPSTSGFLTGLALTPTRVVGGFPTRGRVSWNHPVAGASGARVTLSSSDPNLVLVPASVTIPQGASSVDFLIRTRGVRLPVSVAITATRDGVVATQVLQIVRPGFRGFVP